MALIKYQKSIYVEISATNPILPPSQETLRENKQTLSILIEYIIIDNPLNNP
tara:strand:+ start:44 stop:199 length:156 start_codon:yes stop_codon:yes gene_type:complete